METSKPLLKDENAKDVDVHLHRSMIGSLMYLTYSRSDIMFAIWVWYPKDSPFELEPYINSDYAGASLDKKSTIGEYVAASSCCGQVLWIQNQLLDYGYNFMNTKIFIDNETTICIVKNPVFHSKTKHIKIRHHFIRDSYEKRLIQVIKIHTDHNVVDLIIKVVGDEVVYEEMYDSVERAATTATGLDAEQDRGIISKTEFTTTLIEPSSIGTSSGSRPRHQETMRDAAAQTRRVKRLENKRRSRSHGLKRLYKVEVGERVESSVEEESLGEEHVSKQGRISDIDANQDIYLVNVQKDEDIFGVNDQDDTSMFDAHKDLYYLSSSTCGDKDIKAQGKRYYYERAK
nr:hypothetical protein [Tanacetum cinerariifolium]